MKNTVGSVATDLQTIAHDGEAQTELYIKFYDSFYKIGEIKKVSIHGEQPKEVFAIEVKGFSD